MSKVFNVLTILFAVYLGVIQAEIAHAGTQASASISYQACESYCWANYGDDYGTGIFNAKYHISCVNACFFKCL